jgi:hypothetical protein
MRSGKLWWGLAGAAVGFMAMSRRAANHTLHHALDREDARFHRAYATARGDVARSAPTLVLVNGKFVFSAGATRREFPASAPASQLLKAAAHAPLGVFTLLWSTLADNASAPLTAAVSVQLVQSRASVRQAVSGLRHNAEHDGLTEAARTDSVEVLQATEQFLGRVLSAQDIARAQLSAFADSLGPRLLALTEHATELELSALHAATEAALRDMTAEQRTSFEVVIAGAHQARDRNLPLQYFQRRFGEAPGEERRIAFAESVSDADEARELVGTRQLDRAIARAFFGNPQRLQRDVLGDAAERLLKRQVFVRVGEADSQATEQRSCPTQTSDQRVNS